MASPSDLKIWWDPTLQAYNMVTPYNADFVEAFKKLMPFSDRAWHADSKSWTFTEKYLDAVGKLVELFFRTTAQVVTRAQYEQAAGAANKASGSLASGKDKLLIDFFLMLSHDAVKKAYRQAAMELHPDRGGDPSKMAELNRLYQEIERVYFVPQNVGV